jgi:glycosyltransferase involved in cell wall biosynthesis
MKRAKTGMRPVALIVISDLEFGGAQRQAMELWHRMDSRRFEAHICSLSRYTPLANALPDRDGRLHYVLRRSRYDWTVVPRLANLIRKIDAKVLHCFLFDAEISGRLAGRLTGRIVISSERNSNYSIKRSDLFAYKLTNWARDLTIANSRTGADFNRHLFHLAGQSYRVVYNGVDTNRFQPRDEERLRFEMGFRKEENVVGMFGSFKPQKNHPLLLKAARYVLDGGAPNARFIFIGDELHGGGSGSLPYKQMVQEMVDELGLRNHCRFFGNRSDVERYYPACDLTVLPSLFEGTPNVALESMACGVPVVATDVSDNSYVIPDGKCGFIVPLGDERILADRILTLIHDPELRQRMGRAAREWVMQEFSPQSLAEKTADVYDEVLRMRGKLR